VNSKVIKQPDLHINIDLSAVLVNGKQLNFNKNIYIMMNKPAGVLSASRDEKTETVIDLLPKELLRKGLFPAGRLDKDTEGLLIITDDGDLAHNMLSPKKHIPKTYFAKIDGIVDEEDIKAFQSGMDLGDFFTMPSKLTILKAEPVSEIEITIHEGKFHQVKRMFLSRGKEVVYLKRICMGALRLDETLHLGEARELTNEEKELLLSRSN
jgi:16S rRNA pseudouridine516 synthase